MTVDTPAAGSHGRRSLTAQFVVRVGSAWSPIRAAMIWPIADVLDANDGRWAPADDPSPSGADMVLDLVDSGMIAPPRPRRRRDRPVSSRAVFYQAAEA